MTAASASADESTRHGPAPLTAYSAALQTDGKIVVVGNCIVGLTATMCATRFMADGSLDSAFGTSAGWTLPNHDQRWRCC